MGDPSKSAVASRDVYLDPDGSEMIACPDPDSGPGKVFSSNKELRCI